MVPPRRGPRRHADRNHRPAESRDHLSVLHHGARSSAGCENIIYADGSADEADVSFEYDAYGNVDLFTDELDRQTAYVYNAVDQLIEVTLPDPDGAGDLESPVWSYQYCLCGAMTKMTDPDLNETLYDYDMRRRLKTVTLPDPDGTSPFDNPTIEYAYDIAGNLKTVETRWGTSPRTTTTNSIASPRLHSLSP